MSVLRKNGDKLETISPNFYRTWVGTYDAYEDSKNDIPNGTLIYITDDTTYSNPLEECYPIGSVYISFNDEIPFSFGKWVKLDGDLYLKTANDDETAGIMSGSNSKLITTANLPTHAHSFTPKGTIDSTFKGNASTHTHNVYVDLSNSSYNTTYAKGNTSAVGGVSFSNSPGSKGYSSSNATTQVLQNTTITPSGSVDSVFNGVVNNTETAGGSEPFDVKPNSIAVYIYRRVE